MSLTTPPSVVIPFAKDAGAGYITTPIPVPSQIPTDPGAASYTDGFTPANMTPRTAGGIPPSGKDMNGILFALSAHIAWIAAGMPYAFNADVVVLDVGYPVGAVIRSAVNPAQYFYNNLADNTNDPDSVTTGWIPFSPLSTPTALLSVTPAAGTFNNVAVGKSVGALDVDTTAGNVTYTGITAGSDGQILTVTNVGANLLTLAALNTGSSAANRFRFVADLSVPQNDSLTIRYITAVGKWLKL